MVKRIFIIVLAVLMSVSTVYGGWGSNDYDFMKSDTTIQKQLEGLYQMKKQVPQMNDYLTAIISSPDVLYSNLKEQRCDKEILEFVKDNGEFSLKLLHLSIVQAVSPALQNINELVFVTNYIRAPTAMAATNAQEMGMETQFMKQMYTFQVYDFLSGPEGLKIQMEAIFHATKKAHDK